MSKQKKLYEIASDSLKVISEVGNAARTLLFKAQNEPSVQGNKFFDPNDWSHQALLQRDRNRSNERITNLKILASEPIIGRVDFYDDNKGYNRVLYITRGSDPIDIPGCEIVSYYSPIGRIITYSSGECMELEIKNRFEYFYHIFKIKNNAKLNPVFELNKWNAKYCEIEVENEGKYTILSLTNYLDSQLPCDIETQYDVETQDEVLSSYWDDDEDENLMEGILKPTLERMSLRDQPILDKFQDEIFRLPINSQFMLSGPPGTGKTTTLVRRLGQKIKILTLEDYENQLQEEKKLIEKTSQTTNRSHDVDWLMFSPTELLRQYVKEAFNREGIAAPDDNIQTWEVFRRSLAREELGILRKESKSGKFIESEIYDHLKLNYSQQIEWYNDFRKFVYDEFSYDLLNSVNFIVNNYNIDVNIIEGKLSYIANQINCANFAMGMKGLAIALPSIHEVDGLIEKKIMKFFIATLNKLTYYNNLFPQDLITQLVKISTKMKIIDQFDEIEDGEEDSDNTIENSIPQISITKARKFLYQTYRALARQKFSKQKISQNSQFAHLIEWLGKERCPSDEDLFEMGKSLEIQFHLRKFKNMENQFFGSISKKYKKFRNIRAYDNIWYHDIPNNESEISGPELDMLILTTYHIARDFQTFYDNINSSNVQPGKVYKAVINSQRAQILVDEATDFSVIQLACMYQLTNPIMRSYFICGDLNQRLSNWGVKTYDELKWITPNIKLKTITVSYRQSEKLIEFAKDVAELGGVKLEDTILPDRVYSTGYPLTWKSGLDNLNATADWLYERICEVNEIIKKSTTIGVLVNEESDVKPLALELTTRLKKINLHAVACIEGKFVGNDQDVRVFHIDHIKGLEFESVFFVELDNTIKIHPNLFTKYLYVGATRAATFLGVTFKNEIPSELISLEHHFTDSWN